MNSYERIVIDTREPYESILNYFIKFGYPGKVEVTKIEAGDYELHTDGKVLGIERKTIHDFCTSLDVLKNRLELMRAEYDYTALLIENWYKTSDTTILTRRGNRYYESLTLQQYHNFLLRQQSKGTWLIRTNSMKETVLTLINYMEFLKKLDEPSSHLNVKPIEHLAMLPGVGLNKASKILEEFQGSLFLAYSNLYDWQKVDGIGKKTYEAIREYMKAGLVDPAVNFKPTATRENVNLILDTILDLEKEYGNAKLREIIEKSRMSTQDVENILVRLKRDGMIYEPKNKIYKAV